MTDTEFKPTIEDVKVGSIFVCSWGYDQTNIDFYEVVAKSGKATVKVRRTYTTVVESRAYDCLVAPWPGQFYGDEILTKRLRESSYGGVAFKVASYANAYLWDGRPRADNSGFGGH
jgi:hypothetical protein